MGRVSQRREEKRRRKKIKKRKSPKKVGEKVGKSRNARFFQWFVAPEGRKVGWMRDEKLHAVVARSTFPSQNVQSTPCSDHFWKLRYRKNVRHCGAKHIWKSKCTKHLTFGPLLEVAMSKKCTPLWREAYFEVNMLKTLHVRTSFGRSDVVLRGRRKGLCTLSKVSKTWGFSKIDGRRGAFEEDLAGAVQETCSSELLGGPGADWFPERGCILEHQIFRFAEMILRDRCSTSYDPVSLFRGRRNSLDKWIGKIAKHIGTRPSALHSTFHFWRKSRRTVSFLMFNFENWGSLAELFRFWCCQVQKLRKSRRIVSFLMWSSLRKSRKISAFSSLQIDR